MERMTHPLQAHIMQQENTQEEQKLNTSFKLFLSVKLITQEILLLAIVLVMRKHCIYLIYLSCLLDY